MNETVKRAEARIDTSLVSKFHGLAVQRCVAKGNPAKRIVEIAHDLEANLIVMGTHGVGNVERVLVGSVTAKVLNHADCPVWAGAHISAARQQQFAIHNVLCAVDFTEQSRRTVSWAAQVASEFGARMTLAHVTPSTEIYGPGGYHVIPEFKTAWVSYATQEMDNLQKQTGINAGVFIGSGDVGKTLRQAIEQTGADLLIIGRGGSSTRLGSTAYAIIRQTHREL